MAAATRRRRPADAAGPTVRGRRLGQGVSLQAVARKAGFDPHLFVASAGLGLVHVSKEAPAYGATFDRTSEDAVSADPESARSWWAGFGAAGGESLREVAKASTLVVLSSSYAVALNDDLHGLAALGRDTLLVGGQGDIPGLRRLPADLSLRAELGGTASSLLGRMAAIWLSLTDGTALSSGATQTRWDEWASSSATPVHVPAGRHDGRSGAGLRQGTAQRGPTSSPRAGRSVLCVTTATLVSNGASGLSTPRK